MEDSDPFLYDLPDEEIIDEVKYSMEIKRGEDNARNFPYYRDILFLSGLQNI